MTSHLIKNFAKRTEEDSSNPSEQWLPDAQRECTFCRIIHRKEPAFIVYETEDIIAFLDILPIRPGHTLVVPKLHCRRLSELPDELAGKVGKAVSKVAGALVKTMSNTGLNVVCNQEYAQAVPHVHYHIVPAPLTPGASLPEFVPKTHTVYLPKHRRTRVKGTPRDPSSLSHSGSAYHDMLQSELHARETLDDDDGAELAERIKARL